MNFCLQVDGPITDGGGGGSCRRKLTRVVLQFAQDRRKIKIIQLNLHQAARNQSPEIIIEKNGKLYPY